MNREKNKKTQFTFDEKKHVFEDMTPEEQVLVNHISDLENKITKAKFNLEQLQFGHQSFVIALRSALKVK
jgi:hypothetical protein